MDSKLINRIKKIDMHVFTNFSIDSYSFSNMFKSKPFLIPVILFLLSLTFYSYNLEGQPWHGDEMFFNAGGGSVF